jgi:hypothetical protein
LYFSGSCIAINPKFSYFLALPTCTLVQTVQNIELFCPGGFTEIAINWTASLHHDHKNICVDGTLVWEQTNF